ncbi:hypothetical protein Glove_508g41 [Diversispora epigaea]|uniref:Uncharacterized protein n=1 Tax=Diversispora epigaea TaxID=1348612 RepID=A0A397GG69_9GLOM|nr:hypothetical protein Glove_508g41 [Diversispora epigaea]
MSQKRYTNENNNLSTKKPKKTEALQELLNIRPDLKGKEIYFFPTLDKYFKGIIIYNGKENKAHIYCTKNNQNFNTFFKWINHLKNQRLFKGKRSSLATIFLEPNPTCPLIASILSSTDYIPYWKKTYLINTIDILSYIQQKILPGEEFAGTSIQEISEGLEFKFSTKENQPEKKLLIFSRGGLHNYEVYVLNKIIQEIYLPFPSKETERTLDEIIKIIKFVFFANVCCGQNTSENISLSNEAYRQIDCTLIVKENYICENCLKLKKTLQQIQRRNLSGIIPTKINKAHIYCTKNNQNFNTFFKWINHLKNQRLFKGKRSSLATIFLEPNPTCPLIASILSSTDYIPYWKKTYLINTIDILSYIQQKILPGEEFAGTSIQEISEGLEFKFSTKENQPEKKLLIFSRGGLHNYEVYVLNKIIQEIYLPFPSKETERTLDEIIKIIKFVFFANVCCGQNTSENISLSNEAYRQIDCTLIVKENYICENCLKLKKTLQQIQRRNLSGIIPTKIVYASKEILIEKINLQRKTIKKQNELISNLKDLLNKKIEKEENNVSNEIANIAHVVSEKVKNNDIDISNFHPIFQELIRIQSGKSKGTRYHPM